LSDRGGVAGDGVKNNGRIGVGVGDTSSKRYWCLIEVYRVC
jgi:hypothetical protein